ncbi:MAG: tripeptide aminopeptidase [Cellvibrionaceae bacterium]|jgi:tripeptide aminopeptidase
MTVINRIFRQPKIAELIKHFETNLERGLELSIEIQQIAAPTFAEKVRATHVQSLFNQLALADVEMDELGNVYGRLAGTGSDRPPVIISAHTDTVFPADTDLTIRREGQRIWGPGIADNSAGVAALIWLVESMKMSKTLPPRDIWIVANVGEEGLGDLNGIRAVYERFGQACQYIVLEGGSFGHLIHGGIGVHRFRVTVSAEGGHSWADFGQSSAIHAMASIIHQINQISVPRNPKTTYNIGVIDGGTSINTIARSASFLLDLRSVEIDSLKKLQKKVEAILHQHHNQNGVSVTWEPIGNRPAGELAWDHPLVQWSAEALHLVGSRKVEKGASSTDANIPLANGAAAVCLGIANSGNVHRTDEYMDFTHFPKGMAQVLLVALAAADFGQF